MSEKPEYRHEKSDNAVLTNTENDPELEPEVDSHDKNVSQWESLIFLFKWPNCIRRQPTKTVPFIKELRAAAVTVPLAYHAALPLEAVTFVVDVYLLSNVSLVLLKLHVIYLTSWI